MYKKLLLLLTLLSSSILLVGCWDYVSINQLSLVAGVAIDKNPENNQFHLTAEIINVTSGQENAIESIKVESEGKTIFEAIRQLITRAGRKLYWGHTKIIVFSESVANEGIYPILNFFSIDPELRPTLFLMVSKGESAKEILQQEAVGNNIISLQIEAMLREYEAQPKINKVELYRFLMEYTMKGQSSTTSLIEVVENDKEKTVQLCGTAVFQKDKLVGFLDDQQTIHLNFIKNNLVGGVYVVEVPESDSESMRYISLEITENKTKLKPIRKDGKITINIEIESEVYFAEYGVKEDYLDEKGRKKIEKLAEEQLKTSIEDLIKLVQAEYKVDIFGFGKVISKNMPHEWKKMSKNWNNSFIELEVTVDTKFHIDNTGLLHEQLKGED